jgi:WD40 repeat protein
MGRFFAVLFLAALIGGFVAWHLGLIPSVSHPTGGDGIAPVVSPAVLGGPLYAAQPSVNVIANAPRHGADPIVIDGTFKEIEKMDACSQAPGQILFVGQEVPEGTAQVAGIAPLLQGKVYSTLVDIGETKYYMLYKRLAEGEIVGDHEMVALINPAKAVHAINEKATKLVAAQAEEASLKEISAAADRRFFLEHTLHIKGQTSEKEREDASLTSVKTRGDWEAKKSATKVAAYDLKAANFFYSQHRVENLLPVQSSIIKAVIKRTGETVKEFEPILQLYAIDRLTAEGLVELQFANRLAPGKKAIVEPTRESSPSRVWRSHKKAITAVAIAYTGAAATPLAASASEDGTVCLWDESFPGPVGLLVHAHPVTSLACSPREAGAHFLMAGLSNGSIAVWDLDALKTNEMNSVNKPVKMIEAHGDGNAVTALAFSPPAASAVDGKGDGGRYFASGSTDGSIYLWDTRSPASDFRLFAFDAAHGAPSQHVGSVTSLHFTPQCTLVSAARDNTLRVWELHEKGAALLNTISGRKENGVRSLDVSRDGGSLLFDQDKAIQFLSPDGRAFATLQSVQSISFQTLAEFSPDKNASLLLTAGAKDGRLQLWKTPTAAQRGFELRQLVTSEKQDVTSAAFFDPLPGSDDVSYAVSGTKDGLVYLWPLPTRKEIDEHRITDVTVTLINQAVETRQFRIGVEVPNTESRKLLPGQPVTIVIE